METHELLCLIEKAFPVVQMPPTKDIVAHGDACPECLGLTKDLEQYNDVTIGGEVMRMVHQELYHLSPLGWSWILPHYLRHCLTAEAVYNRFETEFLIYSFSPSPEFEEDTVARMSGLSSAQARCVNSFFEWCLNDADWRCSYGHDIVLAKAFLAKNWDLSS
jgi:hypothetical protein